jgi:hypothetical protein
MKGMSDLYLNVRTFEIKLIGDNDILQDDISYELHCLKSNSFW